MKKAKMSVTYEKRYKHKLNMLELGTVMLKWIGIVLVVGFILRLFELNLVTSILFGIAGAIFLLLLILLAVEAHQDCMLNEIAAHEERED